MSKFKLPVVTILALSAGILLAAADMASAAKAKKISYEEAWELCRKDVQAALPGDSAQSAARYSRGAGCMKQHGYRLKRSSLKQ